MNEKELQSDFEQSKKFVSKYFPAKYYFEQMYRITKIEAEGYWKYLKQKDEVIIELEKQQDNLLKACRKAIELIKIWHCMRMSKEQASISWQLYLEESPKMREIAQAVSQVKTKKDIEGDIYE